MLKATKVYSSQSGQSARNEQKKVRFNPPMTSLVVHMQVLSDERERAQEAVRQEARFLRHLEHPNWFRTRMPTSDNFVLDELKKVCIAISGYQQTRSNWLLTKSINSGLTSAQLVELTAHADAYTEYVRTYNMIAEQGLQAAMKFINAYPLKTSVMELMEAAQ